MDAQDIRFGPNQESLLSNMEHLALIMHQTEQLRKELIESTPCEQRAACINLLHYLAIRGQDLRALQRRLHTSGLSSLSSAESHIQAQVFAIIERLGEKPALQSKPICSYEQALEDIQRNAVRLFGTKTDPDIPYIMITFDSDYAKNYQLVKKLLTSGMNVARINCAHDDAKVWKQMVKNVQRAVRETSLPCKIYMDLPGPKIRTILVDTQGKKHKIELSEGRKLLFTDNVLRHSKKESLPLVGSTIKGIAKQLNKGDRVLFDDGLIACKVTSAKGHSAELTVTRISARTRHLKGGKGVNFPDSTLDIPSLTTFDRSCLPFIFENADLVGYSFVRSSRNVKELQGLIQAAGAQKTAIVLKIETLDAVRHLPALLFQGMQGGVFSVMIARGDLAVELGFERMGEIQEEILWICEAAHVPVIWATQVLETLNKLGLATRSEITDASYSAMAECVMINKGKYLETVLTTLLDIFHRTGGHHQKKRYVFRPLHIATEFLGSSSPIV